MFSVKRPLRFLIHKLELTEDQILVVADALSDFRLEQAQSKIDRARAKKSLAQALASDFEQSDVDAALAQQTAANDALQEAFTTALRRIHVVLDGRQRSKLAFLLGSLDMDF